MYSGMWVASASTETVVFSVTTRVSGAASPTRWIGTSTVTFSPLRTATKSTCSMTRRIGSTWTCLVSASWLVAVDVELEQRVGAAVLERHHRVVARQGHVDRVVAVAVDDGGDLVLAADAAGGALAELGALLGGDLLGGHVCSPRRVRVVVGPRAGDDERRAPDGGAAQ